ncbi:MAG: amino acid ABC transporter substrate-binding protein [Sphaerochaeta sp.]|nr:amino acid ABC transporter substrate-binding protein [Sphaerochaeta sp.]
MKKITIVLLALVLLSTTLFAAGSKEQAPGVDNSLQKVLDKGKFIMGLDDSFPPMGFRDANNEIVGFDVDLAKEIASRMGVELALQPIDWNAKEQELNTGNIDCIWNGFTITADRLNAMTFTPPYVNNAQVVVVKASSPYTTLASLAKKNIGLQAGSSAAEALDNSPAFKATIKNVVEFKENLTGLMDLEIGGIDGLILDLLVANDNINRSGKDFRILDEHLTNEAYGVGFRKGEQKLADEVWSQMKAMDADGSLAKIATKWFGADITVVGK